MQAKGIPVTYMLFPDEGHGFARPENNTAFNAVTEGFLATCLGGRAEPIGDDFAGSSATVPVGADAVPGLVEVMRSHEPEIRDRKSVVEGKSVSVRVSLGGRRIIQKTKKQHKH